MSAPAVRLEGCPPEQRAALDRARVRAGVLDAARLHVAAEAIVIWLDPLAEGAAERVAELRAQQPHQYPVVLGVGPAMSVERLEGALRAGLDDYTDRAAPDELWARVRLLISSRERFADLNPLTRLPGNSALQRELRRRLPQRAELAALAFDVDDFKGYNDYYGHERGDTLLRTLAACLTQAIHEAAESGWFLAHLGGDDFFALLRPAEAETVARRVIELFTAAREHLYDSEDFARGGITTRTRRGELVQIPLATLTVAVVTNEAEDLQHTGQLAAVLAELKTYGKGLAGSNVVADRRRLHHPEQSWRARQELESAHHTGESDEPGRA